MSEAVTVKVKGQLKDSIESAAEQIVMADLSDLSVFENIAAKLGGISDELKNHFPRCSGAALAARSFLLDKVNHKKSLTESDLSAVEETISSLQQLTSRDLKDEEVNFPDSFDIYQEKTDSGTLQGENECANFAALVDQEIVEEYIAQQEMVVSEAEDLILSYEKQPDPSILNELMRLLHTAKGEAGVLGLNRIEYVCHQVEDYIQEKKKNLEPDLLLEFKDWFEQAVFALKNNEALLSEKNLLGALQDARNWVDKAPVDDDNSSADYQGVSVENDEYLDLLNPVAIEDPEITADFISETIEHFEISDENLLILEQDPANEEAVASIFRAFHTIKGTTSFLGLAPISELAHKAENLLDEVRKKHLSFHGVVVDATFNAFDLLKKMIRQLETALAEGVPFTPDSALPGALVHLKKAISGWASADDREITTEKDQEKQDGKTAGDFSVRISPESEPATTPDACSGGRRGPRINSRKAVKQTMKIDADRIDLLLETIGELVIVESIVSREASIRKDDSWDMERNLAQLTKITRSLQDIGMAMRLIPIDATFRKMGRLVRDLAKKTGKKIELVMEGRETELDKSMVERLGDPLVHMIRNAVDHGIEDTPEERVALGKDPVSKILLKAFHQGGNIHIQISDDGRGLDRQAIAEKAMERGLISSAENMSDEEIFSLIFAPGFSTSKEVTEVSGRGVGMDVVKNNIESVRGNVRIHSEKEKGTVFTLVLPLTMAIIDGMIVRVGSERYILPLLSIIESFQPTKKMIRTVSGKGETIPFRNRLLPLFRLAELYNIEDAETNPLGALVVVIEDSGCKIALLVDELLGQNQTVIKNLGGGVGNVDGIAGVSIMPDGRPGLIIDVNGLIKLATNG